MEWMDSGGSHLPVVLFLVGVSIVFAFSSRLKRGESRGQILYHAFKRSLLLIAIGLFVNGFPFVGFDPHTYRIEGVTQRIALCYFFATILELWSSRRGQVIALVACLLGYWAILRFVPVPGFGVARPRYSVHGSRTQSGRVARSHALRGPGSITACAIPRASSAPFRRSAPL